MTIQPKRKSALRRKPAAAQSATTKTATNARATKPQPSGDRTALIKRMWRAADAQVQEIENRLLHESHAPLDRERDARVLAVLAKTLRELSALDESKQRKQTATPADDDTVTREFPRDVDELRRSLAQKLETLIAGSEADISRES